MALHNKLSLKARRKELRNNGTPAEAVLWSLIKQRRLAGRKFRRQHSIGSFIVDFYCPEEKLAIELDGAVHDYNERADYDSARTAFLRSHDIQVIRIENRAVFEAPSETLAYIASFLG